jgi:hypothetical protein
LPASPQSGGREFYLDFSDPGLVALFGDVLLLFVNLLLLLFLPGLLFFRLRLFLLNLLLAGGFTRFRLLLLLGLLFLPALDDGDLVVVVEVDHFLPEHSALVVQPLELCAVLFILALLFADVLQPLPQMRDFSFDVGQSLIGGVYLFIANLFFLVVGLFSRLVAGLLCFLLLDGLLGGRLFHQ